MAIFHFSQFVHELFCWYFKHLNAFLAQCGYYVDKWEILGTVDEGVNSETQIRLSVLEQPLDEKVIDWQFGWEFTWFI